MMEKRDDAPRQNLFRYRLISKANEAEAYKIESDEERMQVDWQALSEQARPAIVESFRVAMRLRHCYIGSEHLLLSLINEPEKRIMQAFGNQGVELVTLRQVLREAIVLGDSGYGRLGDIPVTPHLNRALKRAKTEAQSVGAGLIGVEHLLLGVLQEHDEATERVLISIGINVEKLRQDLLQD